MPATLEEARPQPTQAVQDGEFVDFGWRPIFKEHVNRQKVQFGRAAMERIAKRCNERIAETGDFCPIAIRHTKDDGSFDPEVIGFYGPFRAQRMTGADGKAGKWAVYAKERIYAEDAPKRRKYPRVSVEYWADEADPTGGYFDPASLLGAETPELDLGIHYAADPHNPNRRLFRYQRVTRYEAAPAAPGGSNTFVPGGTDDDEPERYGAGGTLSSGDLLQIVAALKPTIDEAVKSAVSALKPAGDDPDHLLTPKSEGTADGITESPDDSLGPTADELNLEAPGDDDSDLDDAVPGDDDDTDVSIDDELPADAAGKSPPKKPAQYSAAGRESETFDEDADMAADNAEVARYQKEAADYRKQAEKLAGENRELREKYQKAVEGQKASDSKLEELTDRLASLEGDRRKAVRYQKLGELQNKGYTFDVEEELTDCQEMSDAQFNRHCERIAAKYQRVPTGVVTAGVKLASAQTTPSETKDSRKRERYSKLAMDAVMASRAPGSAKRLEFPAEFNRLMTEDPEKIGA